MLEILKDIGEVVIPVILGVITTFLIKFINQKIEESKAYTSSETTKKYLDLLNSIITECIKATNQTYVESLKNKDMFTKEAQKEAFNKTYDNVMTILKGEAEDCLREAVGDLETLVQEKIEAGIEDAKK